MGYRVPMAHGKLGRSGGIFPKDVFKKILTMRNPFSDH